MKTNKQQIPNWWIDYRLNWLMLLLRSPAISLGFTILGEIFSYVKVF